MQEQEIPIHDIKPLLDVPEYSFYYLLVVSVLSLFLLFALSYLAYNFFKNRKKVNLRAEHLKLLEDLSFQNPKKDAYAITHYARTFKDDSPRHTKAYEALVENLETYKYKKEVLAFSEETKHFIRIYIDMLHV